MYQTAFVIAFPPSSSALAVPAPGGLLPAATGHAGEVVLFTAALHQCSQTFKPMEV